MPLSPQDALVYLMVVTSAADTAMSETELARIGGLVERLPVFSGYDRTRLVKVARECVEAMKKADDLEDVLDLAVDALPDRLHDTAYAVAVEVAAVDLALEQEELRWLEMIRDKLKVDRLVTAAIEAAARARFRKA